MQCMHHHDLGAASLVGPVPVKAGSMGTWTIIYKAGPLGLEQDGRVGVSWLFASDWGSPQTAEPTAPNYLTAHCRGRAGLEVRFDRKGYRRPWWPLVWIRVIDGYLEPGEEIEITLGDRTGGSPGQRAPAVVNPHGAFKVLVDYGGTGRWVELSPHLPVPVVAGKLARLSIQVPSLVRPGERFQALLRLEDELGNVAGGKEVEVAWWLAAGADQSRLRPLPEAACGNGKGKWKVLIPPEGLVRLDGLEISVPGLYHFCGRCADGLAAVSNPLLVTSEGESILWGDLHSQSSEALGLRPAVEQLEIARHISGLDFASLQGNDYDINSSEWAAIRKAVAEANRPGCFTAFLGYEWSGNTPGGGDHNVLYVDDDGELLRSGFWCTREEKNPGSNDGGHSGERASERAGGQVGCGSSGERDSGRSYYPITEVYNHLPPGRAMLIPHVGGRYANFAYHHHELEPLIEICSTWGYFEWFIFEALERQMKVGFTGGSDDHKGRPGLLSYASGIFSGPGGLTAVRGGECTRESLWQALSRRRCYATTGTRLIMDVEVAGGEMGSCVKSSSPVTVHCRVVGTAPIERLELRRGKELVAVYRPDPAGPTTSSATGSTTGPTAGRRWLRLSFAGIRPKKRYAALKWPVNLKLNGCAEPEAWLIGKDIKVSRCPDGVGGGSTDGRGCMSGSSSAAGGANQDGRKSYELFAYTVGIERSLWIPLLGEEASLEFSTPFINLTWPSGEGAGAEKEPNAWPAPVRSFIYENGIWAEVNASCWSGLPQAVALEATWSDPAPPGEHAYWVKAVQVDGHLAVASPVYVQIDPS